MTQANILDWLYSKSETQITLGLKNVHCLLEKANAYPPKLSKVIHIAGTNGKGSSSAFTESIACKTEMKTGMFTSPRLISFCEQIRINGKEIKEKQLKKYLSFLKAITEKNPSLKASFFEILMTAALLHFKKENCELIILETGLGGRLDATNAINSDIAILTSISKDHQDRLGNSIAEIATEKAGIIQEKELVFSAPQKKEAKKVLIEISKIKRAKIEFVKPLEKIPLGLLGDHQKINAALAKKAMESLCPNLPQTIILQGLKETQWQGRFEKIKSDKQEIILDGAHNHDSIKVLLKTWTQIYGKEKATLLFSCSADKNIEKMLNPLLPICQQIILSTFNHPRSIQIEKLKNKKLKKPTQHFNNVKKALKEAQKHPNPILITGSLFLVGESKEILKRQATFK